MMKPNEKLVEFPRQSGRDILTAVLRDGAQQMLATAIEAEVDDYLAGRSASRSSAGRTGRCRSRRRGRARRARSCRAARWGGRTGRIRAPYMCTRPPSSHIAVPSPSHIPLACRAHQSECGRTPPARGRHHEEEPRP